MIDFILVATRRLKTGVVEIYPKFIIKKSSDLMIRGRDFYAIWIEDLKMWSTDEQDVIRLIDQELDNYAKEHANEFAFGSKILHLWDAESGMIDFWHRYCQKQMRDSFKMLDEHLIFSNTVTCKEDYASKKLPYPLEQGSIASYDKLMSVLYSPDERHKIEWSIGAVVSGESKIVQKFVVLYGSGGTGKSTVLNIIEKLFAGYYTVFDAKALGSSSNQFALESFKSSPLVGIQHDGDLSRIEDNTRLNSLVSHELMSVNEKFKAAFANNFKCFLFMGTNKPVKITDAKSGLIRRLIDVSPTGNKVSQKDYKILTKQTDYELGSIASHCLQVYTDSPDAYDDYIPINMLGASNDFYNFVMDSYFTFKQDNETTLKASWEMYKRYCDDANVAYPLAQRAFKEELKNYFEEYTERYRLDDGTRIRSYYSGFRVDQFDGTEEKEVTDIKEISSWCTMTSHTSIFDVIGADYPAQYATDSGKGGPILAWISNTNKLKDIDTSRVHYTQPPENHIVIDFDIPGEDGSKSFERNLEAASLFPPTYAEKSKSGGGIHLHYLYLGDVSTLSRVFDDHIEIKVFTGNSALRRRLTECNELNVATISSGLPTKKEVLKMVKSETIKSEKGLRTLILRNLCKEIHPGTASSVAFIHEILENMYKGTVPYDVSDMRPSILDFAARSTHQARESVRLVSSMKFASEKENAPIPDLELLVQGFLADDSDIVFFDTEVFPNLFILNWKIRGKGKPIVRMINPTPKEVSDFVHNKIVGFNCRGYDNHILYARIMGYSNLELYKLSKRIIKKTNGNGNEGKFREAYNLSYTDIYDFASAANKMSLKKWEIELGIHHQELGLSWDEPVPEHLWIRVAEYCDNDVLAEEEVFEHLKGDWEARKLLAKVTGMTVNDSTNSLSTRFIFGTEKNPNGKFGTVFNYRNLALPVPYTDYDKMSERLERTDFRVFDETGEPTYTSYVPGTVLPDGYSIMPFFPGYVFKLGKSTYRDEEIGEGGEVYSIPGMYGNVGLLDVESMHPRSDIEEWVQGPYTRRYMEVMQARLAIKHKDFEVIKTLLDGVLAELINGETDWDSLSLALKTVINSVYGLTAAHFKNAFSDDRNVDNIVAKRGALFMVNLRHFVEGLGFKVAHIKTDSIKIPDATPEIIAKVNAYGKEYGYVFEHEATYDRICLVNKAVYIAKYASAEKCMSLYGYVPKNNAKHPLEWSATGKQFAVPYVFKTLFSGDNLVFDDYCETIQVQSALYLDMNEKLLGIPFDEDRPKKKKGDPEDPHDYHFVGKVGQFCPIKPGGDGGLLMRQSDDKYHAASGTNGFRWLESEQVKVLDIADRIDMRYYEKQVATAKQSLMVYGDVEWFVSDDPYVQPAYVDGVPIYPEDLPFL